LTAIAKAHAAVSACGELVIQVNGLPAPQGSKRHVGNGVMVESSKAVKPWREAVRSETQRIMDTGAAFGPQVPVCIDLTFWLPRPRSLPKRIEYPVKRPDLDKLTRAVLDGIVSGGAVADDSQVICLVISKHFAGDGRPPGCRIVIQEVQ
jgi:crossover junction endodeoxyribonuclease RusA